MPEDVLRLGVDPKPAQKGMREYRRALEEGQIASTRLADTVESNAKRETSIYRRAARERLQLERQIATQRTQSHTVNAVAAAEAFVRAQESYYRTNMARIKAAQARGLMSASDARAAGQQAAAEYNAAIVGALDRPQYANDRRAFTALAGSIKNIGESGRSAGVGMHRLNNSLVVLARRATGAHPVVGQLVDVVGTFAIGTAKMVPILAGLAAIGGAFSLLSREARESKRQLEDNLEVLRRIRRERDVEARGGETQIAVEAAQAEARRLAVLVRQAQNVGNQALVESYTERLREQNRLVAAGMAEIEEEAEAQRARARRERMAQRNEVEGAAQRHQDRLAQIQEEADALKVKLTHQRWQTEDRIIAAAQRERERESQEFHDRIVEITTETLERIEREQEERHREELARVRELEQARERAMKNLVRGLYEVGRAFGGTTDQILSMTAAVLSLNRLPGFREGETPSNQDRAVGYASSALAGIGYGRSTGSAGLGALGGAASGFAMAGAHGAIIGGVSGIISGLMEQGRRAQVAAAQWKVAMRDFETMFSDLTPTEQRQQQLDRAFSQMVQRAAEAAGVSTSISSIEEARAFVNQYSGQTLPGGAGAGMERFIELLEESIRQYEENQGALEKNTEAVRSLTSALNAPSGFRQSYYRWLAQGEVPVTTPTMPGGSGGGVPGGGGPDRRRGEIVYSGTTIEHLEIRVDGSGGPRETAQAVREEFERMALLGGPEPLEMTRR